MQPLQELAFDYIVNNFERIYSDKKLRRRWIKSKIPTVIGQELLTELNDSFLGIHQNYLDMFHRDTCCIREIKLNCSNVNIPSYMRFLKSQLIEKAAILNLTELQLRDWIVFLEGKRLRELSIKGCLISDNNDGDEGECLRSITCLKLFKNLRILDVSCTDLQDIHLKFLSKELTKLQDLNISRTKITNLRHLERFSKLQSLDCSFPLDDDVYNTYLALLNLKCLRNLDISREDSSDCDNPVLRYYNPEKVSSAKRRVFNISKLFSKKKEWSLSDFLNNAYWKDMVSFNLSGSWRRPIKSLSNFINKHKKLEFFGLFGYEFDMEELEMLVTNGNKLKELIKCSDDTRICALSSMTMMKKNIGYETPYMELLEWKSGMGSEDESFKDKVDGINLEVAEVLNEQLDHIKLSYNDNKSPAEHAYLAHSIFCMLRFMDLRKCPHYYRIIKSVANIFLNFRDESFWDHDLTYIFRILSQHFNALKFVCDRNKILARIFEHSDPKFDETYEDVLLHFIQSLDKKKLSKKEITGFIESYKQFEKKLQLLLLNSPTFDWQFDDIQEIMSEFIQFSENNISSN